MDEVFTVEEVASRTGLSRATIRRRCADGKIKATKVGKTWIIPKMSVPKPRQAASRLPGSVSALVDFDASLRHLRSRDLQRDVWVPDVLRYADDLADRDRLVRAAARKVDLLDPPDIARLVAVPKSAIFHRNATDLTTADRLAYHGAVQQFADKIEAETIPGVFSARLSGKAKFFLTSGAKSWVNWRSAVKAQVEKADGWMAETDITAFYDCIDHSILMQDLERLGVDDRIRSCIRVMLRTWSTAPNVGIPQGPDASRVLANFYLHPIDEIMSSVGGVHYFRYMDDIRLVGKSRHQVIEVLHRLDDECKKRNLHLSTKKTSLHDKVGAVASLEELDLDHVNYLFEHGDDPKETRKELKKLFRKAVHRQMNARLVRFSLFRLRSLRDRGVLAQVIKSLQDVGLLGWIVASYIAPFLNNQQTQNQIAEFFHDRERNTSEYTSAWVLAALLEEPLAVSDRVLEYARDVAFDPAASAYHRAVALNVVALSRRRHDIDRIKDLATKSFDPDLVRASVVALRRVSELDKLTESRAELVNGIDITTGYLKGRSDLPSLLFPATSSPVMRNKRI